MGGDEGGERPEAVLICGLGRVGQHCAVLLRELGIPVLGLTDHQPLVWESDRSALAFDRLTVGDCRRQSTLLEAGIRGCRAVLLTTNDERVNISAALAARELNPAARLVIRSSQINLNRLLHERFANLIALDVAELPATALSLAAIGGETVGMFSVDGQLLRVTETRITTTHPWHDAIVLGDVNTRWRHLLHWTRAAGRLQTIDFHGWDPAERVAAGDLIIAVELNQPADGHSQDATALKGSGRRPAVDWQALRGRIVHAWSGASQTSRLALLVAAALLTLHGAGVLLYRWWYPEIGLLDALNVATVLIFDGYSNMFAQLKLPFPIPAWLLLFSLVMTMCGAVVTGMLYASLTARVLSTRLHLRRRPGRIPRRDHTVVIGLGPLGVRVAETLVGLGRSVVCV